MTFEEREKWLLSATDFEIEQWVDAGLRHINGMRPVDYLEHWCQVARHFAYATRDTTWGELEKEFAIIIKRLVIANRKAIQLDAAKELCEIYFNIASEVIGEEAVREKRDKVLNDKAD